MALKIVSSSIPLISLNILSSPPMHIEESPEAFFTQSVVSRHCSLFFPSCQFSNQQRTEIRNPVIRFLRLYIKPEILLSTAAPAELCQSFNAVHELQDLFFHSSQYTMPFKILHYKSFFLSSCAVKTCFRAIGIRQNFIFSDILCESQRRAYDKSCNM